MGAASTKTIRALTAADIKQAVAIEKACFFDAWNKNMWLDELNNSLTTYLALEEDGELIGYAGFWLVAQEAQITRVAVTEAKRGFGLGAQLTAALINKAWDLDARAITLEVRAGNVAAQKVYLTCGFASEGVRPRYYEDNHEDAVVMWLYKAGEEHA